MTRDTIIELQFRLFLACFSLFCLSYLHSIPYLSFFYWFALAPVALIPFWVWLTKLDLSLQMQSGFFHRRSRSRAASKPVEKIAKPIEKKVKAKADPEFLELRKQHSKQRKQLSSKDKQIENLKSKLERAEDKAQKVNESSSLVRAEKTRLAEEIAKTDELKIENQQLRSKLESELSEKKRCIAKYAELEKINLAQESKTQDKVGNLIEVNRKLETKVLELDSKIEPLKLESERLQAQLKAAKADVVNHSRVKAGQAKRITDNDTFIKGLHGRIEKLKNAKRQRDEFSNHATALESENLKLKAEVAQLTGSHERANRLEAKMNGMQARRSSKKVRNLDAPVAKKAQTLTDKSEFDFTGLLSEILYREPFRTYATFSPTASSEQSLERFKLYSSCYEKVVNILNQLHSYLELQKFDEDTLRSISVLRKNDEYSSMFLLAEFSPQMLEDACLSGISQLRAFLNLILNRGLEQGEYQLPARARRQLLQLEERFESI